MSLVRLDINDIRNIQHASLVLNPKLNLIIGRNGSGKTSVLESIYFLGSARSFRSNSVEPLISNTREACLVTGEVESGGHRHTVGVQRNRGGSRVIRIDGDAVKRATVCYLNQDETCFQQPHPDLGNRHLSPVSLRLPTSPGLCRREAQFLFEIVLVYLPASVG